MGPLKISTILNLKREGKIIFDFFVSGFSFSELKANVSTQLQTSFCCKGSSYPFHNYKTLYIQTPPYEATCHTMQIYLLLLIKTPFHASLQSSPAHLGIYLYYQQEKHLCPMLHRVTLQSQFFNFAQSSCWPGCLTKISCRLLKMHHA